MPIYLTFNSWGQFGFNNPGLVIIKCSDVNGVIQEPQNTCTQRFPYYWSCNYLNVDSYSRTCQKGWHTVVTHLVKSLWSYLCLLTCKTFVLNIPWPEVSVYCATETRLYSKLSMNRSTNLEGHSTSILLLFKFYKLTRNIIIYICIVHGIKRALVTQGCTLRNSPKACAKPRE